MVFIVILVVLWLLISYIIYRIGFYTPLPMQLKQLNTDNKPEPTEVDKKVIQWCHELEAVPYEHVETVSFDGLRLCGRYYHEKDGAPLLIGFHGYRGKPSWDFSLGYKIYKRLGFNQLLIEERGHCSSEGHTITFGVNERFDCSSWLDYALARFGSDTDIILAGISMGAATVLMACDNGLPENVKAIIADCPFSSPLDIINVVTSRDMKIPAKLAFPFTWTAAALFGYFQLDADSALESVKATPVPILLIHGEADHFVPVEMSKRIHEANPEMIEFHTFPGAGHGMSCVVDPERYENIVTAFTKKILSAQEQT